MFKYNIFWRSWFFDNNVRILRSEAKCLEMIRVRPTGQIDLTWPTWTADQVSYSTGTEPESVTPMSSPADLNLTWKQHVRDIGIFPHFWDNFGEILGKSGISPKILGKSPGILGENPGKSGILSLGPRTLRSQFLPDLNLTWHGSPSGTQNWPELNLNCTWTARIQVKFRYSSGNVWPVGRTLEMINFTSSFRAKKSMINDVLKYSSSSGGCDIQYLYNIHKRQIFKPFSKRFFFKKIWSNLHHKFKFFKKTLFFQKKGVYNGGPLGALFQEAKKKLIFLWSDCL